MTAAFAAIEARANASVMAKLANAEATVGAGAPFPGIFASAYQQTDVQVGASVPTFTVLNAAAAALASNSSQLVINGVTYLLVDKQPDGSGFTLLVLQEA